jgi:hypothetical protein
MANPFAAPSRAPDPWERMPRENDREWALFVAFRDSAYPQGIAGPMEPRNIARLTRELGEPDQALYELAKAFSWVWRVGFYDRDVDRRKLDLHRCELERAHRDHERIRGKMRKLAELELDKLTQLSETQPDALQLNPTQLKQLLELSCNQDRLAAGEPTARTETVGGPRSLDLSKLNYEQLKQLREIQKAAGSSAIVTTEGESVL